jgi:hypothetical protein
VGGGPVEFRTRVLGEAIRQAWLDIFVVVVDLVVSFDGFWGDPL